MRRRLIFLAAALLFLLSSGLHLGCRVSINGVEAEGLYSPFDLDRCRSAAGKVAEEIVAKHAAEPVIEKRWVLSFYPPKGGLSYLKSRLIEGYAGVEAAEGVYVNGTFIGVTEDGDRLKEALRSYIRNQMPNRAVFGNISGELEIKTVYTRSGRSVSDEDMLLLISGMAPVIYIDSQGRLA